jgi:hypothetical protein
MLAWHDVKREFVFDGSWRDIYVLDTSVEDWQAAFDALKSSTFFALEYWVDYEAVILPESVSVAFARAGEASPLLTVTAEGVQLSCHFFSESQIEFDLDPREILGQPQLDMLIRFMKVLARATSKPAIMTPENFQEMPIIRVEPDGVVKHVSAE